MSLPQRPTMIIAKPYLRRGGKKGNIMYQIPCDNGITYTYPELAVALGLAVQTVIVRVKKWGWQSTIICSRWHSGENPKDTELPLVAPDEANWEGLTVKSRADRLKSIKIGTWESRQ